MGHPLKLFTPLNCKSFKQSIGVSLKTLARNIEEESCESERYVNSPIFPFYASRTLITWYIFLRTNINQTTSPMPIAIQFPSFLFRSLQFVFISRAFIHSSRIHFWLYTHISMTSHTQEIFAWIVTWYKVYTALIEARVSIAILSILTRFLEN